MEPTLLYVTGLFDGVTVEDIKPILNPYGTINNIKIKTKNIEGDEPRTFAIVEIEAEENQLTKCFTAYNNTLWKGKKIKISRAKNLQKKSKSQEACESGINGLSIDDDSEERSHFPSANEMPISDKRQNLFSQHKNHRYQRSENEKNFNDCEQEDDNSEEVDICKGVCKFKGISAMQQTTEVTPSFVVKTKKHTKIVNSSENEKSKKNKFSTSTPKSPTKESSVGTERYNRMQNYSNSDTGDFHSKTVSDWKSPALSRLEGFSSIWRDDAEYESAVVNFDDEEKVQNLDGGYNSDSSAKVVPVTTKQKTKHKVDVKPSEEVKISSKRRKASDFFKNDEQDISPHQFDQKIEKTDVDVLKEEPEEIEEIVATVDVPIQKASPQNTAKMKIKRKTVAQKLEDNEKRMRSIREKQSSMKAQQRAIQNALSSVKSKEKVNKKIVFSDDDDDDDENEEVALQRKEHSKEKKLTKKLSEDHQAVDKKKPLLFDEDADDESPSECMDEVFRDKQQFHGSYGEKLLELQTKFGADERFKIDERFIEEERPNDEDGTSEDDENGEDSQVSTKDKVDNEKLRSLDILKDIVKDSSATVENEKKKKKWKIAEMVRYDVNNPEHAVYEQKIKKSTEKKKHSKDDEKPVEDNSIPVVSKDCYYQVDSTALKDAIAVKKESFSLLNMFDNMHNQNSDNFTSKKGQIEETYMTTDIKEKVKNPLLHQTSDDEDSQDETEEMKYEENLKLKEFPNKRRGETFFIFPDDQRLTDGIQFFHRKEEWHVDYQKWVDIRQALKRNIKIQGKRSVSRGGRRKIDQQRKAWKTNHYSISSNKK